MASIKTGAFRYQPPIDAVMAEMTLHAHGGPEGSQVEPQAEGVAEMLRRDRDLEDYLPEVCVYTGNLIAGVALFAHGLTQAWNRVLVAYAFYDAGGNVTKPLNIVQVDATNVSVNGGAGTAAYRVTLLLAHEPTGW